MSEAQQELQPPEEEQLVVSRKRVTDHGEVYTPKAIVNAMLDLVAQETERIDSRFLEPACGTGNFLAEVLTRKLEVVKQRYSKSQSDYERYAILALSSIYGIDILEDNVTRCRERLLTLFKEHYQSLLRQAIKEDCLRSAKFILERNIEWGDALTLMTVGATPKPIIFSEWSAVNGTMLKRRDFSFKNLLQHESTRDLPLFSDLGEDVFLPTPIKEYPLVHFLKVADAD
jgi:hypothetical protein